MEMANSGECKNYGDRKTGKTGISKYDIAEQLLKN
jgi:hypothetical protein